MKIEGTQDLSASRERIYEALSDPEVLKRCIPGCQSLERTDEGAFAANLKAGVGAIKGNFTGTVRLEDMRPPEHYRIVVDAKGGPGWVKGAGDFDLEQTAEQKTSIKYSGEMQAGGPIAGIGQRMIQAAAKMLASQFFKSLESETGETDKPEEKAAEAKT